METKTITNSSQVSEIGYDKESKIFEVIYKNGAKYQYYNVEEEIWTNAQSAESVGKYVAAHVKPHKFQKVA